MQAILVFYRTSIIVALFRSVAAGTVRLAQRRTRALVLNGRPSHQPVYCRPNRPHTARHRAPTH